MKLCIVLLGEVAAHISRRLLILLIPSHNLFKLITVGAIVCVYINIRQNSFPTARKGGKKKQNRVRKGAKIRNISGIVKGRNTMKKST
jgi:hypothetical protein